MKYDLNAYAVVEDDAGIHVIPSYRKGNAGYTVHVSGVSLMKAAMFVTEYVTRLPGLESRQASDFARQHLFPRG